ncbi:MAG TPA: ankyrin repeat domain-containing protein [Thermoanaerobaculia bacterium]
MLKLRAAGGCLALALMLASSPCLAQDDPGDALRRAASAGDLAKVQELLAAGVDVNAANKYGGTALAFACDKGHTAVVNLLLERGANPNSKDTFYGATPLNWAVQKGHAEIVRALLAKGAEGEDGALTGAASEGQAAIVKVILERGKVGPEALSDALAAASKGQQAEVVTLLEAAGAKPPAVVTVDPAILKTYEGVYESPRFNLTVALKDGKLIATADGGSLTLAATDPTTFRAEEFAGIKIQFQSEGGKVTGLTMDQGGGTLPFKKKETP